tara:strand:+ start:11230 stop:11799 length:570 start_codon:yes stop_codon:yes gene_type:complete
MIPRYKLAELTMYLAVIASIHLTLTPLEQPSIETVQLEPITVTAADPVALHLYSHRWPCTGHGCADNVAIDRIADAIRYHSERLDIPIELLVGIVMVEDPWLDTLVISTAGAVGLFQVMPMHTDAWVSCGYPLETIEGSTCRGAEIIADFLHRANSEAEALLWYNGCRHQYCEGYANKVNNEADLFGGE